MRECDALYCKTNVSTPKTLQPGLACTKALLARYGTRLQRARFRCDEATRERREAVELIIQKSCRLAAAIHVVASAVSRRIGWSDQ